MFDLNSVLLEGVIHEIKEKRDHTGHWVEIRNRRKGLSADEPTHRFRVEVGNGVHGCRPEVFTIGRKIRVVGSLRRESRLGPFVKAETVEVRGPLGASV